MFADRRDDELRLETLRTVKTKQKKTQELLWFVKLETEATTRSVTSSVRLWSTELGENFVKVSCCFSKKYQSERKSSFSFFHFFSQLPDHF